MARDHTQMTGKSRVVSRDIVTHFVNLLLCVDLLYAMNFSVSYLSQRDMTLYDEWNDMPSNHGRNSVTEEHESRGYAIVR